MNLQFRLRVFPEPIRPAIRPAMAAIFSVTLTGKGSVKERVTAVNTVVAEANAIMRAQQKEIALLLAEKQELGDEVGRFKKSVREIVDAEMKKLRDELEYKHAFMVVQNKNLINQVKYVKQNKTGLVDMLKTFDRRVSKLEVAVGEDDDEY